jgi:pimeloyl-ACP methyl ester carboxylesterase
MYLEDFALDDGTLNVVAAAQQCALCAMTYEKDQEAVADLLGADGELVWFHEAAGTWLPSVTVCKSGPNRYFACSEGTVNTLQGIAQGGPTNSLIPYPPDSQTVEIGAGLFYWQAYLNLAAGLADHIPLDDPATRVYFSGHSMGGAIAQLAAYEFARNVDPARVQVLTLGQPQALSGGYTGPQPAVYMRVRSLDDLVPFYPESAPGVSLVNPLLPLSYTLIFGGWRHYGREYVLSVDGTVNGPAHLYGNWPEGVVNTFPGSHKLPNYLGRLEGAVNQYAAG